MQKHPAAAEKLRKSFALMTPELEKQPVDLIYDQRSNCVHVSGSRILQKSRIIDKVEDIQFNDHISNMDEIPVSFDLPSKFIVSKKGSDDANHIGKQLHNSTSYTADGQ
ncbi:hypothetical protein RF11_00674 [Thelohanellus kitauei]|uniref:Uncharacterized protein n=1 Tax=Thelohanellus kitauei TaxID=669202 RepID=A0A0C2M592_THEKT|nr:hypothetical protein RF11_00674 [Thelohanellus kitauei]